MAKEPAPKRLKSDTNDSAIGPSDAAPLQIQKLRPSARTPTRGSAFAAGYDLYSAEVTSVPARGRVLVETALAIAVPAGTCMPTSPSVVGALLQTQELTCVFGGIRWTDSAEEWAGG